MLMYLKSVFYFLQKHSHEFISLCYASNPHKPAGFPFTLPPFLTFPTIPGHDPQLQGSSSASTALHVPRETAVLYSRMDWDVYFIHFVSN